MIYQFMLISFFNFSTGIPSLVWLLNQLSNLISKCQYDLSMTWQGAPDLGLLIHPIPAVVPGVNLRAWISKDKSMA